MIKVLGHRGRGGSKEEYQNTEPAFKHALEYADGIEMDVTVSSDSNLLVVHDVFFGGDYTRYMIEDHLTEESVKRLSNRRLDEMSTEEICSLKTHNGLPFPLFSEFIDIISSYPDAQINVELKSDKTADLALEQCESAVKEGKITRDQIMISSFNYPELLICKEKDLGYRLSFLVEPSSTPGAAMQEWLPESKAYFTPLSEELLKSEVAQKIDPWSINMEEGDLTVENVKMIKSIFPDAKILIWWWAGNPEPQPNENKDLFDRLTALKEEDILDSLYAIITDFPKEMKKEIQSFL